MIKLRRDKTEKIDKIASEFNLQNNIKLHNNDLVMDGYAQAALTTNMIHSEALCHTTLCVL
jgi:hypothetical protein